MDQTFMKERKIIPLVLSMSLPMVLSMLVNSLYNIVDSYFVAKVSEDAMTALSLVYPVQIVVTAISVGFGVGINAMIAYFLGAGDEKSANNATTLGTLLSAVHGLLLTIVCIAFIPKFLGMFTKSENVIALGLEYAYIAFAFSMIITVGIALEKIYQAVGQMKVTMLGMTVGFVSNIVLDPLLIFGVGPFPRMGMSGAALATGIGQTLTLICYIVIYILRPIPARISLRDMHMDSALIGKLYSIGIPATLNMALPSLLISALNGILDLRRSLCSRARRLLQAADLYLSSGQRYHSRNPASCRLQLWCERIPACKEYFYDRPHNGFRDHASRADSQLECSCSTDWNLYCESCNDHNRRTCNAHNQLRFHRIRNLRYLLRCTRRTQCRNAFPDDLASALSDHHDSCSFTALPPVSL